MSNGEKFTKDQYSQFCKSVIDSESKDQLRRIRGRFAQRRLVADLGKETCDAMWRKFLEEHK